MRNWNLLVNKEWNRRRKTIFMMISTSIGLMAMLASSLLIDTETISIDLYSKNASPALAHPFGTDWLGRDMLARTIKGLGVSFYVGALVAMISTAIALIMSLLAFSNKVIDACVTWLIDLFLSVPHIVVLILFSFAIGGGFKGVVVALSLTHWPSLTRLLRAEVLQLKNAEYVAVSQKLGRSNSWIAKHHIVPYLAPQIIVGFILIFPHAILHEATITFLGFGLSPEKPAIGIILSESLRYLSTGNWWLAFFPGLSLLLMVITVDALARNIQKYIRLL